LKLTLGIYSHNIFIKITDGGLHMYYKILDKSMKHYGMQYKEGLNVDVESFDPRTCCGGGLFFSDEKHILGFCGYGDLIAEVTIPEGEKIVPVENKYKANKIILSNIRILWDIKMFKELKEQGINIHAGDDYALRLAAYKGYLNVVKYLIGQGADIHACNDDPLIRASENGHLEVIKYLVEQGADIYAYDNYALQLAAYNGYLNVVKYLVEKGADIYTDHELALRWSAKNGHIEVVKYLIEQGTNVHADNDLALRWAEENGHLEVVEYLENQVKES